MWELGTWFPSVSHKLEVGLKKDFIVKKHFTKNRDYNLRLSSHNLPTSNCLAKYMLHLTRWIAHLCRGWQLITAIYCIYSVSPSGRYQLPLWKNSKTDIECRISLIWKSYSNCPVCFHWKDWKLKNKVGVKLYIEDTLQSSVANILKRKGRSDKIWPMCSFVSVSLTFYNFVQKATNMFKWKIQFEKYK